MMTLCDTQTHSCHLRMTFFWLTSLMYFCFYVSLCRKSCLTHTPSSTSCSSSSWRPCSLSASCLFSATICGSWERTGRLSVCKNQFDSIALIELWTAFPDYFFNGFSETFSAPVFTSGRDKSGFSLGCSRNVTEVFGDRAKYWMVPVYSRWANGERAADLYHTGRNIAEKYWLFFASLLLLVSVGHTLF